MSGDWKEGLLVKIPPQKSDLSEYKNWRGITLLSVPIKVFTRILLNRLKKPVVEKLRREQFGFRENRSCVDQINTLSIIIEQSMGFRSHLYLVFVDFERAFDSVIRTSIIKAMKIFGIPEKIKVIEDIYRAYACKVEDEGGLSDPFEIKAGVRQGCQLSLTLLLMVLDIIMKVVMTKVKRIRGIQWNLVNIYLFILYILSLRLWLIVATGYRISPQIYIRTQ
jgi:hypothetical protein